VSNYTSAEFQRVRTALLACSNADHAYLRASNPFGAPKLYLPNLG